MGHLEGSVSTTQLARLLILSERRIQQLVRSGILKHALDEDDGGRELRGRFRFVPNLHAYLRYLRGELGSDDRDPLSGRTLAPDDGVGRS